MRTASFSRRRARLRLTAPPRALLAVKPNRARSLAALGFSPRARACNTSEGAAKREPSLTYRNSARVLRRPIAVTVEAGGALQRPVKPTGAYAPWPCAVPAPCGRPWSPCGRGSRAAACGRAEMVDRCASRQISNGCRVWRLIGAASGQVNAEPRKLPVRIPSPKVGEDVVSEKTSSLRFVVRGWGVGVVTAAIVRWSGAVVLLHRCCVIGLNRLFGSIRLRIGIVGLRV